MEPREKYFLEKYFLWTTVQNVPRTVTKFSERQIHSHKALVFIYVYNYMYNVYTYILSSASFCLRRQWGMHCGLVCLVAAPAVAVQSNTGTTGSIASAAVEVHTWLCGGWTQSWICHLPSVALSSLPTGPLPFTRLSWWCIICGSRILLCVCVYVYQNTEWEVFPVRALDICRKLHPFPCGRKT